MNATQTADASSRWTRRSRPAAVARVRVRRTPPTVVLMYHRVVRRSLDPLALCVTPENFAEQVAAIGSVADIVAPHRIFEPAGAKDRPRVAITFDDGYADNLHHGLPVLEAHDAPACIFATNAFDPDAPEYWWDQLEHLFLDGDAGAPFVELNLVTGPMRFDLRSSAGRQRTFSLLNNALRDLACRDRQDHLDSLHEQLGRTPVRCAGHGRLLGSELAQLANGGLVEIGGHTAGHAALPVIDRVACVSEIVQNRDALAGLTGHRPRLFAYPYGSYARANIADVRAEGYTLAFLARSGPISALTNPLAVPRLAMKNWSGAEFVPELRHALGIAGGG